MREISILLVDDEEIILVGWQEELESAGYKVSTASSGKEAVEMVKQEKPDLVITDIVMPEMNGIEVCREVKKVHPEIEVVFVSGHPREIEKYQMEFIKLGGREEYLRKPLFKNELIEIVNKITRKKN